MAKAPPPLIQKLNAALHEEPISWIAYTCFWMFVLVFCFPITMGVLAVRLAVQLVYWKAGWAGEDDYNPSKHTDCEFAVVITGCDSGFGKEIALRAAEAGYIVFAGCLNTESSFEQFRLLPSVIPVKLDVTNDDDVSAAVSKVKEWIEDESKTKKRVLHALINNAGIGLGFIVDLTDVSVFQKVMDVNFFGVVRCCKAFLPFFKEQTIMKTHSGSRIFNLTSLAGLNPAGPGAGAYAASKHAAQAFSQTLRGEMVTFRIQVSTINPSFHSTPLVTDMLKAFTEHWEGLPEEKRKEYGDDYFKHMQKIMEFMMTSLSWNVNCVVDQTLKLLKTKRTPPEVVIGMDGRFLWVFFRILPAWVMDGLMTMGTSPKPDILKE